MKEPSYDNLFRRNKTLNSHRIQNEKIGLV